MEGEVPIESRVPLNLSELLHLNELLKGDEYFTKALENNEKKNFAESFKFFVLYFESLDDPSTGHQLAQVQFKTVAVTLALSFVNSHKFVEAMKVYLQALNLFPCDPLMLNKLGEFLLRADLPNIARTYLERAISYKKNYTVAQNNLMYCKWAQVPRWHFRMLNDVNRNSSYFQAIAKAVRQGFMHVVNVGAGCGLLSLVASHNPAVCVTAIEENIVLAKMCQSIMKENGRKNVQVLNINSTSLKQAPTPCNLLVTELFDCALFGEGMLGTLLHAHQTLITDKDSYRIIPCGARLYAAAITYKDSQSLRVETKVPVLGLDKMCIRQKNPEPYEAEDLTLKKFSYVSEPVQVYQINFYDSVYLCNLIHDCRYSEIIEIYFLEDALMTSFAVWFELDLDEFVTVTTDPRREDRVKCWEQAVFHLPHPIAVEEGKTVKFEVFVYENTLQFFQTPVEPTCESCFFVPEEVVTIINDTSLVAQFIKLAEKFRNPGFLQQFDDLSKLLSSQKCSYFPNSSGNVEFNEVKVMDMMTFSFLGLMLAANMGWKCYSSTPATDDKHYLEFVSHIISENNIIGMHVGMTNVVNAAPHKALWDTFAESVSYKAFLINPVDMEGLLSRMVLVQGMVKCMYPGCVIMPVKIVINVVLIHSEWLQTNNVVHDENVFNFKIAQFMNEYSSTTQSSLDSSFTYTEYSDPIRFSIENPSDMVKATAIMQITKTGQVNALYTWFDINFHDGISYSTKESTHFRKACYLLDRRNVQLHDRLKLVYRRYGDCLSFAVEVTK